MSTSRSAKSIRTVALTSLAGTSIEWYDFFLYGTAAALVFPTLYFPPDTPPLVGLLASFATFAVGFLARPVGGIVFGHYGDRIGRKRALVIALVLMGIATALIGCLPTYGSIGVSAPILLMVLRFTQGFAIGGQWAGAVLLITESAPPEKRGFYGSFAQVGVPAGIVLANLAFFVATSVLSSESFMSWGWRALFLVSVALVGIGIYIQLRIEDSEAFRELIGIRQEQNEREIHASARALGLTPEALRAQRAAERRPSPILEALREYPRQIALSAGAFMAVQTTFYILVAFVVAYGSSAAGLGLPQATMLGAVLIGALVMIPALLAAAAVSDRFGRRGIYMAGAAGLGLWAFALFPLIETRSFLWITVAISVGQVFIAMMYGPQAAFVSELFSTRVRYSAASLGYQLGAVLGGAVAPLVATAILARTGRSFGISVYVAIACLITLISTLLLDETARRALPNEREQAAQRADEPLPATVPPARD